MDTDIQQQKYLDNILGVISKKSSLNIYNILWNYTNLSNPKLASHSAILVHRYIFNILKCI